jgi:hypothetical protein
MIIDLDAHQGNGHELDFAGDSMLTYLSPWWFSFTLFCNVNDRIFTNRTSLYTGYVQPWNISFCKLPALVITIYLLILRCQLSCWSSLLGVLKGRGKSWILLLSSKLLCLV